MTDPNPFPKPKPQPAENVVEDSRLEQADKAVDEVIDAAIPELNTTENSEK